MPIRVRKTKRLAVMMAASIYALTIPVVVAQQSGSAQAATVPNVAAPSPSPASAQAVPKPPDPGMDGDQEGAAAASTGLDYLYNKKPADGSLAGQAARRE